MYSGASRFFFRVLTDLTTTKSTQMNSTELPRELLWDDRETIEELFDESLNKELYNLLQKVRPKGLTSLRLLNEAWYISECIYYDDHPESKLGCYLDRVMKDLNNKTAVAIVMGMVYTIFMVQKDSLVGEHTSRIAGCLELFFEKSDPFDCFVKFCCQKKKDNITFNSDFRPHRSRGISKAAREKAEAQMMAMDMKIAQLEGELDRTRKRNKQLEDKLTNERIFTSMQIIDYAEGRVEWSDCRPLLAMVKDPSLGMPTKQELDRVAEVERKFKQHKFGDHYEGSSHSFSDDSTMLNINLPKEMSMEELVKALPSLMERSKGMKTINGKTI